MVGDVVCERDDSKKKNATIFTFHHIHPTPPKPKIAKMGFTDLLTDAGLAGKTPLRPFLD